MAKPESVVGDVLRRLRKAAGLSQMKVAEKLGMSYQQVQKYEKGASRCTVERLGDFAEAFGVSLYALLDEAGFPTGAPSKKNEHESLDTRVFCSVNIGLRIKPGPGADKLVKAALAEFCAKRFSGARYLDVHIEHRPLPGRKAKTT